MDQVIRKIQLVAVVFILVATSLAFLIEIHKIYLNRSIDLDRITNTLDEKIANLQKYKRLFQKKLKNYAINKLSTLNYIRNDTENIINNILNIKIIDGQKLITSPDNLLKGGEYKLNFNKKIFKIKII